MSPIRSLATPKGCKVLLFFSRRTDRWGPPIRQTHLPRASSQRSYTDKKSNSSWNQKTHLGRPTASPQHMQEIEILLECRQEIELKLQSESVFAKEKTKELQTT